MPVSAAKGAKGRADRLCGQIVRARGRCERCGATERLAWCHIVRRTYAHTRTLEDNAWCLCFRCHQIVDTWHDDFLILVEGTIGKSRYDELKRLAREGVGRKFDWDAEVARLKAVWAELKAAA